MRFGLEAAVASGIFLVGLTAGCRSPSREVGRVSSALPPPPSTPLTQAIADGERASLARLPPGPGQGLVEASCLTCHGTALIEQQHKDSAGWTKTVGQMRVWGARLSESEVPALIDYLIKHYGVAGR